MQNLFPPPGKNILLGTNRMHNIPFMKNSCVVIQQERFSTSSQSYFIKKENYPGYKMRVKGEGVIVLAIKLNMTFKIFEFLMLTCVTKRYIISWGMEKIYSRCDHSHLNKRKKTKFCVS